MKGTTALGVVPIEYMPIEYSGSAALAYQNPEKSNRVPI
jgi:hypothetical protein